MVTCCTRLRLHARPDQDATAVAGPFHANKCASLKIVRNNQTVRLTLSSMDRTSHRPSERQFNHNGQAPSPGTYPQPFPPPTAQPPIQLPAFDPFHTNRDPFRRAPQDRRGSFGLPARAWPPTQGEFKNSTPYSHKSEEKRLGGLPDDCRASKDRSAARAEWRA